MMSFVNRNVVSKQPWKHQLARQAKDQVMAQDDMTSWRNLHNIQRALVAA